MEVGSITIIMTDAEIIRCIGATLLTRVGGVVAISKFRGVGGGWRRWGTTMDDSLEAQWLA